MTTSEHSDFLMHFAHQVVYRYMIGLGLPPLTTEEGAKAILAGLTVAMETPHSKTAHYWTSTAQLTLRESGNG